MTWISKWVARKKYWRTIPNKIKKWFVLRVLSLYGKSYSLYTHLDWRTDQRFADCPQGKSTWKAQGTRASMSRSILKKAEMFCSNRTLKASWCSHWLIWTVDKSVLRGARYINICDSGILCKGRVGCLRNVPEERAPRWCCSWQSIRNVSSLSILNGFKVDSKTICLWYHSELSCQI